jgi:hypothetical protein
MVTRRKAKRHRERLSEKTPKGDAIVRSHTNSKYERYAEMTYHADNTAVNRKSLYEHAPSWQHNDLAPLAVGNVVQLRNGK